MLRGRANRELRINALMDEINLLRERKGIGWMQLIGPGWAEKIGWKRAFEGISGGRHMAQ